MTATATKTVRVDDDDIRRAHVGQADLLTDWSAFPHGYGILLNERLMYPLDLSVWRMTIDRSRQLFVDDYLIAHMQDLTRAFHSPRDHDANPLLALLVSECLNGGHRNKIKQNLICSKKWGSENPNSR